MKIAGVHYRTIWVAEDGRTVEIIDQTRLPHELAVVKLQSVSEAGRAIKEMLVRGAPLVGVTAAYGVCLGLREDCSDAGLVRMTELLAATRPTAVNLQWALDEMASAVRDCAPEERVVAAYARAAKMADEDVETCRRIGEHGLPIIRQVAEKKHARVNILTHCNAGWLATVDWGTALAPIYMAHDSGIDLHVWVDETRPRNQGASLTAFELGSHGVDHTIIVDNAGGHLMQHGLVDLCIVGTDRTAGSGDVANKIGTYLKALAAHDNQVPFYVALPHSTIDWEMTDGIAEIPIEERDSAEVTSLSGRGPDGRMVTVDIAAPGSPAANYAFDVTPARLVTGLITDRGVCRASAEGLGSLFPERA
jgi:methylthioribose-1-phosphate isomerase